MGEEGAYLGDEGAYLGDEGEYEGEVGAYEGDEGAYLGFEGAYEGDEGAYLGEVEAIQCAKQDGCKEVGEYEGERAPGLRLRPRLSGEIFLRKRILELFVLCVLFLVKSQYLFFDAHSYTTEETNAGLTPAKKKHKKPVSFF